MNGSYLLDTNAAIALLASDPEIIRHLAEEGHYYLCPTVVGELYFGAYKSDRVEANLAGLEPLLARRVMLGYDRETAQHYGKIQQQLRRKGRPIPHNDMWVAACAARYGLTLLTRDRHFDEIEDLAKAAW